MDQAKLDWLRGIGLVIPDEAAAPVDGISNTVTPSPADTEADGNPAADPADDPFDSVLPPSGQNGRPGAGFPTGAAMCRYDKAADSVHVMIATYGGLDLGGTEVTLILWGKRGLLRLFKCKLESPERKDAAAGTATYIASMPDVEAEIEKNGVSVDLSNCQIEVSFAFPNGSETWRGPIMGAPKGVDAPLPVEAQAGPGSTGPHIWFREGIATCVWDQASDTLRAKIVAVGGLDLAGATMYFEVAGPDHSSDQYEYDLRVPIAVDRTSGLAWYEGVMPEFGAGFAKQDVKIRPKDIQVEITVVYAGGSARWIGPIKG